MHLGECSLTIVIVGAKNLKNVSTLGKLDPYVRIKYGGQEYETCVVRDSGCNPIWNYEMCLTGTIPKLTVQIFDSHIFKDRLIGSTDIIINSLPCGVNNLAFNLHHSKYPDECTGVLLTKISVFPSRSVSNPYSFPIPISYGALPCNLNNTNGYVQQVPSSFPQLPSIVVSDSHVQYPTSQIPNSQYIYQVSPCPAPSIPGMGYSQPYASSYQPTELLRRSTFDNGTRERPYTCMRIPAMTPQMFPIIPNH